MAHNRHITDLPKAVFTHAIPQTNIPDKQLTALMGTLSSTGWHFNRMFREELYIRAMRTLCEAILDDDREPIKRILVARPDMLLAEPPENLIIESKLTWQKFYAEKPLILAVKRKQIEILEFISELGQTEVVQETIDLALQNCSPSKIQLLASNEIDIPYEYLDYIKSLVEVFSQETFPNGNKSGYGMLSDETESALSILFNRLMPAKEVKLDQYLDVELLLLAAYKASSDHFYVFKSWEQRDAFSIRVRGLIQSFLTPGAAKIFCESFIGMMNAMEKNERKEVSKEAQLHKLKSGESFYRSSRDSKQGAGFDFCCGLYGRSVNYGDGVSGLQIVPIFSHWYETKARDLQNLCSNNRSAKRARL